nr:MAG TPA: hypothetical protein [Caudoviricetes sp.]
MSTAQITWQRQNTRQVGLRLNRNQDADIIDYLESTGSPSQTIRRLIREEITRTGWTPTPPRSPAASLSLDGGQTFTPPEDLDYIDSAIAANWDAITAAMDQDLYADTDANFSPCSLPDFLRHYLAAAGKDLIV